MTDPTRVYGDIVPIPMDGAVFEATSEAFRLDQWKTITDFAAGYTVAGSGVIAEYDGAIFKLTTAGPTGRVTMSAPVTAEFREKMRNLCIGLGVHFW